MTDVRRSRTTIIVGALLAVGAVASSFPFAWMITTSLKPLRESRSNPPQFLQENLTLESYARLFGELAFGRYLVNTLVVVAISVIGMFLMAMAGYGFAKFRFRGKQLLFVTTLMTLMIPVQVSLIPTYLILTQVNLTGTLVGIALPTLVSAFGVFLFREFMTTIPDEMIEAARLDGASEFRTFVSVVLPMSKPILAVQAVLTFISGWNSFLWPLVLAGEQKNYTLAVGLSLLNQQQTVNPPLQMAGAAVMVVPIVVVFIVFQKHIVQGFMLSGMK